MVLRGSWGVSESILGGSGIDFGRQIGVQVDPNSKKNDWKIRSDFGHVFDGLFIDF